jgi:hypothetical protein
MDIYYNKGLQPLADPVPTLRLPYAMAKTIANELSHRYTVGYVAHE